MNLEIGYQDMNKWSHPQNWWRLRHPGCLGGRANSFNPFTLANCIDDAFDRAVIVSAKFFDKRLKFRDEFWMRIGDKKEKKRQAEYLEQADI